MKTEIVETLFSKDNLTRKYVQKTYDGHQIETVYVDYHNKNIICYSTQIGCNLGCKFCYNGLKKNFKRNLSYEELISQIENVIEKEDIKLNKPILFSAMGIGEPLLNYENLIQAIHHLNKKYAGCKFALATTGVDLDAIRRLNEDIRDITSFKLIISLHAPSDEIRKKLIPTNKNIEKLVETVKKYREETGREIEWNYCLIEGINDAKKDAIELCSLVGKDEFIKINHFNEVSISELKESRKIDEFIKELENLGLKSEYYETNGEDINGACGQLISN